MPYAQYADLSGYRSPSRQAYYDARPRPPHAAKYLPPELGAAQISRPRSTAPMNQVPGHRRHVSDGERFEQIYTWVAEQDFVRQGGKYQDVQRWLADRRTPAVAAQRRPGLGWTRTEEYSSVPPTHRRRRADTMLNTYREPVDEAIAMAREREAEARRRNMERVRAVAEEMRRIEERIRIKREMERQKLMEERRVQEEFRRERRRTEQATLNQAVTDAWEKYERRWDEAKSPEFDELLTFRTMPWPLTYVPKSTDDIHPHAIAFFLLSPLHSRDQPRKDRIKNALLRWHPDRFHRLLDKVDNEDKEAVEEGVGIVVRCLNDLLTTEIGI